MFTYINKLEQEIRNLYIGGIPGIKIPKISKKFVMSAPDYSKTNLSNKEK